MGRSRGSVDHRRHPEHLQAMPVLRAGCGMRAGEWFGLALEDVDFDEMTIRVRRQIQKLGRAFIFALPKMDKERTIPMSRWVADHLRAHIDAHKPRPYTLPWEKLGNRRPGTATTTRPFGSPRSSRPGSSPSRSRTNEAGEGTSRLGSRAHTSFGTTSPASPWPAA
ncbi:tyrosine-type recombinase/integrase [Nonomuraea dietziae]|uniref:tyrosine-type recombinase/integrase n=1 Tax=Nonomuraea dietziae TaxID=65515 RepID=UPI0034140EC4